MTEPWHKTETSADTAAFSADFWQRHREAIESGEFWADKIKHIRDEPTERLRLAIENLPLPAAFREAAIATRVLIRERRKQNAPYEDQLMLLYWLAAINSFGIPYSNKLQTPGYNVVEAVPGTVLKSLPFTYTELGYKKLELLNKTDVKWLVEAWSEPRSHSTLHKLHHALWQEYEDKVGSQRQANDEKFVNEFQALLAEDRGNQRALPAQAVSDNRTSSLKKYGIAAAILLVIVMYSCTR